MGDPGGAEDRAEMEPLDDEGFSTKPEAQPDHGHQVRVVVMVMG